MFAVSTLLMGFTAVRALTTAEISAQLSPKFECQDGQGEHVRLLATTRAFHFGQCAMSCEAREGCVAFDFTEDVFTGADRWKESTRCRMFGANANPTPGGRNDADNDARRFCTLRPTVFYDCEAGVGGGAAAEESRAGSHQDCGRRCAFLGVDCVGFDYTRKRFRNAQDDSLCRVYRANTPQLGPNTDDREYCTITPAPPTEVPEFACEAGRGQAGESIRDGGAVSHNDCAFICDAEPHCVAFDFAAGLGNLACRLFNENTPELGPNADRRSYCVMGGTEVPEHDCVPGQGEAGTVMAESAASSAAECARKCDSELQCAGFDYTERVLLPPMDQETCRLYPSGTTPRVGGLIGANPEDRKYCTMVEDEFPEYTCQPGQGQTGSVLDEMKARSKDGCSFVCEQDDDCIAFDFRPEEFHDDRDAVRCRLYGDNHNPQVGPNAQNPDNREYCELFRVQFTCQNGQGEAGQAFRESRGNSYNECERRCERDARCVGFDYTAMTFGNNGDNQACRLYRANAAQIGDAFAGPHQRKYCARAEICGKAGQLRGADTRSNVGLVVIPITQSNEMTVCQCQSLCQAAHGLEWRFQVVGGQCDCFSGVRKVYTRPRTGNSRERYLVGHFADSQARFVD